MCMLNPASASSPADKAINLLDEAGSCVHLFHGQVQSSVPAVTEIEIQQVVSAWTGIPVGKVCGEETQ